MSLSPIAFRPRRVAAIWGAAWAALLLASLALTALAAAHDHLPDGRYFDSSNRRRTDSAASRIPSEALTSVGAKLRSRRRRSSTVILA